MEEVKLYEFCPMFQHNLLLALRHFKRNKTSFFINLIGLSTGLACALMIYLFVHDELYVDKFHEKDSQLYKVMQDISTPNGIMVVDWTPGLLAQTLKNEIPEIEYAVQIYSGEWFNGILSYDNKFYRANGQFVGKDFFDVFSYPLIQGDKSKVLSDKNAVIISEEMAVKLFHTTENVIGKTIEWSQNNSTGFGGMFSISGVFKDIPKNSTQHFDLIFNYEFFSEKYSSQVLDWRNSAGTTNVIIKKGVEVINLNEKISNLIGSKSGLKERRFFLKQFSKIYLYGTYKNGIQVGGRIDYIRLFSIIALFILAIASINFMNLSTAKASRRIKEVGVKKSFGVNRKSLVFQFMGESILITFLSLFIAILLVENFLPQFNEITGKHLQFNFNINIILSVLGITFFTGLISGSYPAIYLSGFNPIVVLKGKLNTSLGELWVRKGLVIFQFTISVIFIVLVLVVYHQMVYIQTKNLGYSRDNIICISKEGALNETMESFLFEVKKMPGVLNAASSNDKLIGNENHSMAIEWPGKTPNESMIISVFNVSYDFLEMYNIELSEGRSFSREYSMETSKVILNEAAVNSMKLSDPIGKTIKFWGENMQIIGVTKNFLFQSLHENVKPCLFQLFPKGKNSGDKIWIKIKGNEEKATIESLKKVYQEFNPGFLFEFKFLDDDYKALYNSENKVAILSKYFSGLAILISCLGLFGLAAFTTERRRKEIGVRKIFGSSVSGIIYLVSGDFTRLVSVSITIALPVSYLIARHWLNSFAYRIRLEWWFFVGAGLIVLFIAGLTVGTQALIAANTNPSQCLKEE